MSLHITTAFWWARNTLFEGYRSQVMNISAWPLNCFSMTYDHFTITFYLLINKNERGRAHSHNSIGKALIRSQEPQPWSTQKLDDFTVIPSLSKWNPSSLSQVHDQALGKNKMFSGWINCLHIMMRLLEDKHLIHCHCKCKTLFLYKWKPQ